MNLFIKVFRRRISHQYKKDMTKKDEWFNNDFHNMMDLFCLFMEEERIFSAKCQTVANIPGGRYMDTIAVGSFKIRLFVDPRSFYGRIHGICNCYDLEGQYIDSNSIEKNDFNRWLIHDTQSKKPKEAMMLTRVAWSAGCFVMSPSDLEAFGAIIDAFKMKSNEMIDGELLEVE